MDTCAAHPQKRVHNVGLSRQAGVWRCTWTSYRRTSSLRSVDFPEPLGPTTAQLCPGSTFRLTPFSTGRPGWYLQRSRGTETLVHRLL